MIFISKYKGLNHIYPKDIRAMSVLAKTGAINKDTLNKLGISNTRIKNMERELIQQVFYPDKYGTNCRSAFVLTQKGKEFCKRECNIYKFISNGQATFHNQALSSYLVNNLSQSELNTCLSEREFTLEDRINEYHTQGDIDRYEELMEQWKWNSGAFSLPDITYVTDTGQLIAVECITDSYGHQEIQSKIDTATILRAEIVFVRAE